MLQLWKEDGEFLASSSDVVRAIEEFATSCAKEETEVLVSRFCSLAVSLARAVVAARFDPRAMERIEELRRRRVLSLNDEDGRHAAAAARSAWHVKDMGYAPRKWWVSTYAVVRIAIQKACLRVRHRRWYEFRVASRQRDQFIEELEIILGDVDENWYAPAEEMWEKFRDPPKIASPMVLPKRTHASACFWCPRILKEPLEVLIGARGFLERGWSIWAGAPVAATMLPLFRYGVGLSSSPSVVCSIATLGLIAVGNLEVELRRAVAHHLE
jgi:hypothetical protein